MSSPERKRLCEHCSLPLPRRAGRFCCSGCYIVHHLPAGSRGDGAGRANGLLARLIISALLAMGVMVLSLSLYGMHGTGSDESFLALRGLYRVGAFAFSVPVMFMLGAPLAGAVLGMRRWLSIDALVLVATLAAWCVSMWNTFFDGEEVYYDTATMVILFFGLGKWLDTRARERASERLEVVAREAEQPVARLRAGGGVEESVAPQDLAPGDLLRLRPGDVAPVDGLVVEGATFVDASALTGEERPVRVGPGDEVLAGVSLVDGTVVLRTTAARGDRVRDRIDRLLDEAVAGRCGIVLLADRAVQAFLPLVVLLALGVLVLAAPSRGLEKSALDALSVVLIACPCALGLATPLAFWVALGEAWKRGVLVRDSETLERLARARRVFLDKTGTLTSRGMRLRSVVPIGADGRRASTEREALRLAAALEVGSEHPIARAILSAWHAEHGAALPQVTDFEVLPGRGARGSVEGRGLVVSAVTTEERSDADAEACDGGTRVRLTVDGVPLADFVLAAEVRPEARAVVRELEHLGLELHVLTGDAAGPARALAAELELPVSGGLLPDQKLATIDRRGAHGSLFVGDGLNDHLALAAADVGIAVRGASARTMQNASVNLLREGLHALPGLVRLSRSAVLHARVNLIWALGYNAIGLGLATAGRLTPVFAASAMVVSSAFVVLNSSRIASSADSGAGGDARRGPEHDPSATDARRPEKSAGELEEAWVGSA